MQIDFFDSKYTVTRLKETFEIRIARKLVPKGRKYVLKPLCFVRRKLCVLMSCTIQTDNRFSVLIDLLSNKQLRIIV